MNRNHLLHPSWRFYIIGIIASVLLFTSCVVHKKYPSEWGNLIPVEENKCPDISGTYRNRGEGTEKGELLSDLFKFEQAPWYVQITRSKDGTFEISGLSDEVRLVYKKSKYSCTQEGVEIPYTKGVFLTEGLGGLGIAFGSFYLTNTTDGSLIIKDKCIFFGLSFIIPVIGTGTNWYRFEQKSPEMQK